MTMSAASHTASTSFAIDAITAIAAVAAVAAVAAIPAMTASTARPAATHPMSEASFRALLAREGDRWLRLAVRLAGESDGPDVLQEALVKAWLALSDGSGPGESSVDAARWVVRVVINQAFDTLRARSRRRRWSALFQWVHPTHVRSEITEAHASVRELERFVNALTAEQRVTWILREVEGYSGTEVAALTSSSEGAVEQRLLRARAAILRGLHEGT